MPPNEVAPSPVTPQTPSGENKGSLVLIALLVVLLLMWGYFHFFAHSNVSKGPDQVASSVPTASKTQVVRADVGIVTIPPGFPSDIPVGPAITQSYSAYYPKNHVTQYTVSYVMSGKMSDVVTKYLTYLKQNGYTDLSSTDSYAVGTQGNHTLSVSIGPYVGRNGLLVTVNLLVH